MAIRTDVKYVQSRVVANDKPGTADFREKLPEYKTPDALRPGYFVNIKKTAGDYAMDSALLEAERAHTMAVQSWERLGKMRETQSPAHTQYVHLTELGKTAEQSLKTNGQFIDSARTTIASRKQQVHKDFKERLGYSNAHAAELRQVLRGMKEEDSNAAIQKAVQEGDGAVLAAVLDAPPLMAGIGKDIQAAYQRQAMNKHYPQGVALLDALDKADDVLGRTTVGMFGNIDDLTGAEIRLRREAEAEKARQAQRSVWGD